MMVGGGKDFLTDTAEVSAERGRHPSSLLLILFESPKAN